MRPLQPTRSRVLRSVAVLAVSGSAALAAALPVAAAPPSDNGSTNDTSAQSGPAQNDTSTVATPGSVEATVVGPDVQVSWRDPQVASDPAISVTASDVQNPSLRCTDNADSVDGSCVIKGAGKEKKDRFQVDAANQKALDPSQRDSKPSDAVEPFRQAPTTDLTSGMTLNNADLSNLDLSNLDLSQSNLAWDNFSNSSLANTNLSNTNLAWDTLTGADLSGTDLSNSTLYGATSGGIVGTPAALPDQWNLTNGYLVGPGAILTSADLSGASLVGASLTQSDLAWSNLTGSDLTKADLRNADLSWANLKGANLEGADLSGATLLGVSSGSIVGTPAALPDGWSLSNGFLVGPTATLAWTDLSGTDLSGVDLSQANLAFANLANTNLDGVDLSNANLYGVSSGGITGTPAALPDGWNIVNGYLVGPNAMLTHADLSSTKLFGLNLSGADLAWANLSGSIIGDTNLSGADLSWATVKGATFKGTDLSSTRLYGLTSGGVFGDIKALPDGWQHINGFLAGPNASLVSADFAGANLSRVNLSGANLAFSDLTKANLAGTDLTNANLAWTTIRGAIVKETNFDGANTWGITSGDLQGDAAGLPEGWAIINGYLVGSTATIPWADFSGQDLSGLDLSQANFAWDNLSGVNLDGTDLSHANLFGVSSGQITGTPAALPDGWRLENGYLVGPGATLAWADLRGADLSGMNLAYTNLAWANLSGADLHGTDLSTATLLGVTADAIVNTPDALPKDWKVTTEDSAPKQGDQKVTTEALKPKKAESKKQLAKAHRYWAKHPAHKAK